MTAVSREIEAKYRVQSFQPVRRRLREAGGEYLCTMRQVDTYYDTGGGMLLGRDCGLRIRTFRCLRRGAGAVDTRPLLTVKGPAGESKLAKIRREVQTRLDDCGAVEELIFAIGLEPTVTVVKRRASYRLGRCLVELDELPVIGRFVEIEAPLERNLRATAECLGLYGEAICDHYVNLLQRPKEKSLKKS